MEAESTGKLNAVEQISRFVAAIFDPGDLVEIRILPAGKQIYTKVEKITDLAGQLQFANEADGSRQNIYIGVNPRKRKGGEAKDVALARVLVADFDHCSPEQTSEQIKKAKLPEPSMIVDSGHGTHAYWRLAEPMSDLGLWTRAQKQLIKLLGSDPVIHDPPRILRLPGFYNVKNEPVPCVVVSTNRVSYTHAAIVGLEETWPAVEQRESEPLATAKDEGEVRERMKNLSRTTMAFLLTGEQEGKRQRGCFLAACDFAGNGIPQDVAEKMIVDAAMKSGGEKEGPARQAIESAYKKPRGPSRPIGAGDDEDGPMTAMELIANEKNAVEQSPVEPDKKNPEPESKPNAVRPIIGNCIDRIVKDKKGEAKTIQEHVILPVIAEAINKVTGGWPRRAGGIPFALHQMNGSLPDHSSVNILSSSDDLFAWIRKSCNVRWTTGQVIDPENNIVLNPPTKNELYSYIASNSYPSYKGFECLPHYPVMPDVFYLPCEIPAWPDADKPGPLDEFITSLNPETELDRLLLFVAILTPGWGGAPGTRPAFVFTSDHGRGSGKTATAESIAYIWKGVIKIGINEDVDQVRKRLLCDESLSKRILLMDNIKGRTSSGDLESIITSSTIDGWRPYHGQASRPNNLTVFMTSNSPSLSRDLAERSIVIKIGPHKHQSDFVAWAREFIDANRPTMIAQCLAWLARPNVAKIKNRYRDRWHGWQEGVLSKVIYANELAALAIARRPDVDSDLDDAEQIAHCVIQMIKDYPDLLPESSRIFITRQQLYGRLIGLGVIDRTMTPRAVNTWIRSLCNSGPLHFLKEHKMATSRGWVFVGAQAEITDAIKKLPDSPSTNDYGRKF